MEYVSSLSLTFTHFFLCGGDAHSPNTRVIDPFQINPVGVSVDPSAEESLPHVQEGRLRQALGQAVGDLHLRCDQADADQAVDTHLADVVEPAVEVLRASADALLVSEVSACLVVGVHNNGEAHRLP